MFVMTVCSEDLLGVFLFSFKRKCVCESFCCLGGYLVSIMGDGLIIDSWFKCSWFLICSLKGISQIMHQCLSSWKQLSGECIFLAAVFPAHPDREQSLRAASSCGASAM